MINYFNFVKKNVAISFRAHNHLLFCKILEKEGHCINVTSQITLNTPLVSYNLFRVI